MATIKPFKGIRFNQKEISKLICPPYDVISQEEKKKLVTQSKFNIVKVELSDVYGSRDKYQQAAYIFNDWLTKNILVADDKPAYYFYEQVFNSYGKKTVRTGFFAAMKLENPAKGNVKPHEKTLAKPKQDRLSLLRQVKANISPIFGLYNDKNKKTIDIAKKITKTQPVSVAKEAKTGVMNRLWCVDDAKTVAGLTKALSKSSVFIADGHHRYETAWNYLQEMKNTKGYDPKASYNYVLTFLCPMEDKGLVVWPTHRVVEQPKGMEEKIEKYFNILPASEFAKKKMLLPQPMLVYLNGKSRTLTVKSNKILTDAMPDKCKAYQDLAVSILHSVLLSDVAPENIIYVKNDKEAVALAKKKKVMAVIVPSTPVDAVKKIALAKQTMPQKSTYFYPKVVTGMVIHSSNEKN